jgi:hypothetical protein
VCPAGELLVGPDLKYDSYDEEVFEVCIAISDPACFLYIGQSVSYLVL